MLIETFCIFKVFIELITAEGIAQIQFLNCLVAYDLGGRPGTDHPAMIDYIGLINYLQGPFYVMIGDENAYSRSDKMPYLALQVFDRYRVNSAERLIKQY